MRASIYRRISSWLGLAALTCLLGCAGAEVGAPASVPSSESGFSLAWPPQGQPIRVTSDDTVEVNGSNVSYRSINAQVSATTLVMPPQDEPEGYSWGIYILEELGLVLDIAAVDVYFQINPVEPGDDTALYMGVSNYELGVWEWEAASGTQWHWTTENPATYTSESGKFAVACVAIGAGECVIESLTFHRAGTTTPPPVPTGLAAEVFFPTTQPIVRLTWDNMGAGVNYNIQRSQDPLFAVKQQVNSEGPVPTNSFDDESAIGGRNYYYRVTSIVVAESAPSTAVFVRTPEIDLPAPPNIRITGSGADFFTVEWDWGVEPVTNFHVLVGEEPDFDPDGEGVVHDSTPGWALKRTTFDGLPPNQPYWVRMYADYNGYDGRMSEAIPASTEPLWEFSAVEILGPGQVPMAAIAVDGDLSAAYVNGGQVMMARRDNGTWTSYDTTLDSSDQNYGAYVDIGYANSQYIVAFGSDDLNVAFGFPGEAWTNEFVANGTSGQFQPPVAGTGCKIAANETEVTVIHMDHFRSDPLAYPTPERGLAHTRLWSSGSWVENVYQNGYQGKLFADNAAMVDGNLFIMSPDLAAFELKFGDRAGGYTWEDISNGTSDYYGTHNDMINRAGTWHLAIYDQDNRALNYLSNDGSGWQIEVVAEALGSTKMGLYCRIDERDGEPFIVFNSVNPERTYFATSYGGSWVVQQVLLADGNPFTKSEVVGLGTDVYVLFKDRDDDLIKCIKATPPPA